MHHPGLSDDEADPAPGPNPEAAAIRRTWRITGFAALLIAFSVAPILNNYLDRGNKDYVLWYYVGKAVSQGQGVYPKDGRVFPFMYPPSAGAMLAIASQVGPRPFIYLLVAVNSAAWAAAVFLSVSLATGRVGGGNRWLFLVPSLGVIAYIHDTYLLGQPNLLLLACMLGAFAALRARRSGLAGALIAFAAAVKAFPVMAVGYLVYRRMWKATASLVVCLTLMMIVLPMPFRGVAGAYEDVATWTQGMVLRYDSGSIAQRPERGFGFKNQSLMALANRLLRDIPADAEARDGWKVNLASLPFGVVNKVILASAVLLGGLFVALMPWKRPEGEAVGPAASIEVALLLLLILMFSPLSFNYFYVWLLYPMTVALHLGLRSPRGSLGRRVLVGSVAGSIGSLALSIVSSRTAAGYGNSFMAAAILFAALGWRLAVEPGLGSPVQLVGALIRRGLARSPTLPSGRPTPFPLPAPHLDLPSKRAPEAEPRKAR